MLEAYDKQTGRDTFDFSDEDENDKSIRKAFKDSVKVLEEVEALIEKFISDELKKHLGDKEVKFGGYALVVSAIKEENKEEKINLASILEIVHAYPLSFKFQGCEFDDVKFANESLFILRVGLHFEKCIFDAMTCHHIGIKKNLVLKKTAFSKAM